MTATPAGDHLRAKFGDWETTHWAATDANAAGCAAWHSLCAYEAGRAEALRALADDLEADARALETLGGDLPWAAMLGGIKVKDAKGGAGLLRRAAGTARERAGNTP